MSNAGQPSRQSGSAPSGDSFKKLNAVVKRRRMLPLASTTVAALGLAGCAMGGGAESAPHAMLDTEAAPATLTPQQQLERRVREFTSGMDVALDKVDRERLRAAAEKKNVAAVSAQVAAQTPPSGQPPVVQPAAQTPVLLASSGGAEAAPAAPHATPHAAPAEHAAPPAAQAAESHATEPALVVKAQLQPPAPLSTIGHEPEHAAPQLKIAPVVEAAPAKPSAAAAAVIEDAHAPAAAVITPLASPAPSPPAAMGAIALVTPSTAEDVITPAAPTAPVVASAPVEPTIDDALAVVRKKIAAHPTLGTALGLALLDTGDGKTDEVTKSLPDADQKLLADLLAALQGMNGTTGASVADRAAPLVEASRKWQAQADLTLPRLVLATRVDSFGVYKQVEPKFEQGKRHTVIIYCEVANFGSKKGDDGWFQTRLSQQETLITEDGLLLWRPNAEEVEDRSMNQRKDFYLVKKLTIPENLAVGKYTLQMKVTDRNADKFSLVSLPIEIVSK